MHITVDGLGNPLRFILTGGQDHDITQAEALLAGYAGAYVIADKGCDARWRREYIAELAVIRGVPARRWRWCMTRIYTGSVTWGVFYWGGEALPAGVHAV